ncbi:MAG: hypothetical protein AB7H97_21630, partial [Pseudobdellovibrionaceae bacterium]
MSWLYFTGFLFVTQQNCAGPDHKLFKQNSFTAASVGLPAGSSLQVDQALQDQSLQILSVKCGSCHDQASGGGIAHILDVNNLIGSGLITAGDPTRGRLLGAIADGTMPKSGAAVTAAEFQILKSWISSMVLTGGTLSGPLPAGKTVEVNLALHDSALQILNVNCAGCHQKVASGGLAQVLDVNSLVANGFVKPGDPNAGRIMGAIADGSMPKGKGARVSASDIQTLKNWISAMKIVDDVGQPRPVTRVALSPTFSGVFANVIQPKCVGCHGPIVRLAGKRFDSYATVNSSKNDIQSECQSGNMPDTPYPRLDTEELAALKSWIAAGAPNN